MISEIEPITLAALQPHALPDLVRIGRENDGGYLIPERVISKTDVLIGLGIEADWSFEQDFLSRNPRTVLAAVDESVGTYQFLRRSAANVIRALKCFATRKRSPGPYISESVRLLSVAFRFNVFFEADTGYSSER
jgi:hypothetical protein